MIARIFTSAVIAADVDVLWREVRDFNGLPRWHPAVLKSDIEGGLSSSEVGCVRNYARRDELRLREQLIALDDRARSCTYVLLDPPIPVTDYVATMRLLPVTCSRATYLEWTAEFVCGAEREADLTRAITEVFEAGFRGLGELVGSEPGRRA